MLRTATRCSTIGAHRASYFLAHGVLPERLVRHTCDVRLCVNPAHLVVGTHQDNSDDMVRRGRVSKPLAKLNKEKVIEIRFRFSKGATAASLAKEFHLSLGSVFHAISGHTWKDVDYFPKREPRNFVAVSEAELPQRIAKYPRQPPPGEQPPACGCGCGRPVRWRMARGWVQYCKGHSNRKPRRRLDTKLQKRRRHWSAILTDAKVVDLRNRYANGESRVSLMREFNIGYSTVSQIVDGETWRHLL